MNPSSNRRSFLVASLAPGLLLEPSARPQAPEAANSVSAPWDIKETAVALAQTVARLKPLLEQLNPSEWVQNGAPDAYLTQWRNVQSDIENVSLASNSLAKDPEKLTLALGVYFKFQDMDSRLTSLNEGVRKYQNPAVAELIISVAAENSVNREKLRQYITDLAEQKEIEFSVADREAQRCRTVVNRQPPAPAKAKPQTPPAAPKPIAK